MLKKRLNVNLDDSRCKCSSKYNYSTKFNNFDKKGQITIFIILGILLLLALIITISLKQEVVTFKTEEIIPTEKGKVEHFITNCIDQVGDDALFKIGLQAGYIDVPPEIAQNGLLNLRISPMNVVPYWAYGNETYIQPLDVIKQRIDGYMNHNVHQCLYDDQAFQETYDIVEKSDIIADTKIVDSKVIFDVYWDLEIRNKAGELVTEVIDHQSTSPVKLKKVHEMATRIVEKEMTDLKFEDITQDLIALEHPNVPVAGMDISCSKKTWEVSEVENNLMNMLRININEIKIQGTEFEDFPEDQPYYQNHYIWNIGEEIDGKDVSVVFNFDEKYPYTFAVTPLSGTKMKSSSLGGNDLLSFLCVQNWKFTYDLVYPIHVRVRDETTGYNFNIAFTSHLIKNYPNRNAVASRESYALQTVTDEDYCQNKKIPMTVKTYELVENKNTGVYNTEPLDKVNTSFTCIRYRCEMPQTEYDFEGRGDVSAYTANFPYCVGGILRGTKEGYKETWKRVVTDDGKEIELGLTPLFKFPTNDVKIIKHQLLDGINVGVGQKLSQNEVAMVTIKFYVNKESNNNTSITNETQNTQTISSLVLEEPYHQSEFVYAKSLGEEVLGNQDFEFLAKADYEYDLEINVFEEESFIGGYKGKWNVNWNDLENANQIEFHVIESKTSSEEEMFEMMMTLDEKSNLVPSPTIS